jgi:hypothetical protein
VLDDAFCCPPARVNLSGEGAAQLVEGPLGAVLWNVLDVVQTASEGHHRIADGRHLGREHGFHR